MNLDDRINTVLADEESKNFLHSQLSTIRDNILESEKRISKYFLLILSLIGLSVLIEMKLIQKIGFLTTEISNLNMVLIAMPCIVAYYTYSLFNQLALRKTLNNLFTKIIKSKYPKVTENDLDDFLITHLGDSIETILTRGDKNWVKRLVDILSAPFFLVYQYLPLWYCYYLLYELFHDNNFTKASVWTSFIITSLFFLRIIVLTIAAIKADGGIIKMAKEILGIKK